MLGSDATRRLGIDVVSGLGVGGGVDTAYHGAGGLEWDNVPFLTSHHERTREFGYKSIHQSPVVTTVRRVEEGLDTASPEIPPPLSFSERLRARSHERLL